MALNMNRTGNYAFLVDQGRTYLDKTHLLFWLAAFSYKIFGVTSFAYKGQPAGYLTRSRVITAGLPGRFLKDPWPPACY